MTDKKVFSITTFQIEQFLKAHGFPPLTWLERLNLRPAFRFGSDIDGFIKDAMHYLRGDDIGVVDDPDSAESQVAGDAA